VAATTTTTQVVIASSIVASSVSTMVTASSPQTIWAVFNQYQLLVCLPLLRTYVSVELNYFINEFKFAAFDFQFIDYIPFPYIDPEIVSIDYPQADNVFADNDIESQSVLVNQVGNVKLILVLIFIHTIII
jgi:hypothetical protein